MKLSAAILFFITSTMAPVIVAHDNGTDANMTSARPDPIEIKPDKVSFQGKPANVMIFGSTCNETSAHGTGTFKNGAVIKYDCLETGYYERYNWAIACGTEKHAKGEIMCQGFRQGGQLTPKDSLVSEMVSCSDIVTGECGTNATDCRYNCSQNMCQAFHGIDWFEGYNYAFGDLFKKKTRGTVVIEPKRLTINQKGKAFKWRKVTMSDLCFETNAITTCYQLERITSYGEFMSCLKFRFHKHVKLGWLGRLDEKQLMKAVDAAELFKQPKKKKHKKRTRNTMKSKTKNKN